MMHQIYAIACQNKRTKRKYVKWGYTADSFRRRLGRLKASYKNLSFGFKVIFEVSDRDIEYQIHEHLKQKGFNPIYKREFFSEESLTLLDDIMNRWHRPSAPQIISF